MMQIFIGLLETCCTKKSFTRSPLREYFAAVESHPVDKAGTEYLLARALLADGRKAEAEESVLAALEVAPGYAPAQKLLLELHQPSEK